ncbi:hypothetical protein FHG87_002394 [Trinorchestia longiramus]|nr:hypothetical protein FHG87_002394 [Trinorchestia longiramus]
MNKVVIFLLVGLAVTVCCDADAAASAEADADPAILVTEHRGSLTRYPGYVVHKAEHIPGYGYKKLKAYQPGVAVKSVDTSQTFYPDPIHKSVKYVHYASPPYHNVPDYYANSEYYGGSGYYGGGELYGVHNYLPYDNDYVY